MRNFLPEYFWSHWGGTFSWGLGLETHTPTGSDKHLQEPHSCRFPSFGRSPLSPVLISGLGNSCLLHEKQQWEWKGKSDWKACFFSNIERKSGENVSIQQTDLPWTGFYVFLCGETTKKSPFERELLQLLHVHSKFIFLMRSLSFFVGFYSKMSLISVSVCFKQPAPCLDALDGTVKLWIKLSRNCF